MKKKAISCASFLILIFFFFSTFNYGAIPAEERAALIALYNSTNGDNWTNNSGWKNPPLDTDGFAMPGTEGTWYGITTIDDYVRDIDLPENNLNGTIPPELGNLNNLQFLYLNSNILTGTIPTALGNLSNLVSLILNENQLTGNIPSSLGNLNNLKFLYLNSNNLTGSIPSNLGNLSSLEQLILKSNNLSGEIPVTLGNLNNLMILHLYFNKLSGSIPTELGNLSNLDNLILESNLLTGSIPASLGNLSNLRFLSLNRNQLSGSIPKEIGNLTKLEGLLLFNNQLSGSIPKELGNLTYLYWLSLKNNQFTGDIPVELGDLINMVYLYLNNNKLSGAIPTSLTSMTKLKSPYADIGYNCLYANDDNLRAWLDSVDPDWESHQDDCDTTPTVTTNAISSITSTSAVCGGNVTSDGSATVTARGVCWSTSSNPTTANSNTIDGSGTGSFTSSITGLSPNTTYFVRSYATNSQGTSYGNERNFTTLSLITTYTLYVKSTPETGVGITVNPNDNDGNGSGSTYFSRTYNSGTQVTLTAPAIYNGKNFLKWKVDNVDKTERTINVTMDSDHTAQAVYQASSYTLTVQSSPDSGAAITVSPNDNNDKGNGNTQFIRTYDSGTIVTLTAPSSCNGKSFLKWLIDGSGNINRTINVNMNRNHTVQAVYQSDTYTLTVQSSPYTGVDITVSPADNNGYGNGNTNFTRNYNTSIKVTLTAPSSVSGNNFIKWTLNGEDNSNTSVQVIMEGNQTAVAYYESSNPPEIAVNRSSLNLGYIIGSGNLLKETFVVYNSGGGTLNWNASTEMFRISVSPTSGVNCGTVEVTLNAERLTTGKFRGVVYITDPLVYNSPVEIEIKLWVRDKASPPFGDFATPIDNSTVYSSIPVTGWVLSDTGVESVKIYRGEEKGLVYIGDAVFVEGARPDVETAYPDYPMNYKAGWGYMMLTNFLPNGGNGTFKIHAIVTDKEGNTTTLETKTIHVDNANAVKPFGAIDTPTQGGTASGSNFINWGWVLTPQPNSITCDGSTIKVWVDGVNLGHPKYCLYREDIATLFPDYANSNGAAGYFYLDTTAYEDGVHTIQWTATDNAGNTDGIGSRYFTIQNTGCGSSQRSLVNGKMSLVTGHWPLVDDELSSISIDYSKPVKVRKGYNEGLELKEIYPDDEGTINIEIKELERVEFRFEGTMGLAPLSTYTGFLVIDDQLKSLPIGSTLDTKRGIFTWQPGPGFYGTYEFVFIKTNGNNRRKVRVRVKILPKYPGSLE